MPTVKSKDGTAIGYEKQGSGAALIIVDGALGSRAMGFGSELASLLAGDLTVCNYDRRGRNESGDTQPYAVEREVEDIEALIDGAGGSAFVYGISSGAALALEAAARLGGKVKALALYEPPYGSPAGGKGYDEYEPKLNRLLAAGRRGEAVVLFMSVVGVPPDMIAGMRQSRGWPGMEAIAPTLAYDAACMNGFTIPYDRASRIQAPTLAMNGGEGFDFMRTTAKALAEAIPNARYLELPGQRHDVDAKVLAPVLADFFCAAPGGVRT
jgi:pimeloyl-ACP methyl ester carboxylesterase